MSLPKLKIFYIISLVILSVLVVVIVFQPLGKSSGSSEVQREQLLQTENEWIIQVDILNREGKRQDYMIKVLNDDKEYTEDVSIGDGRIFSFIHHIQREETGGSDINLAVYTQGDDEPIEQIVYHLK